MLRNKELRQIRYIHKDTIKETGKETDVPPTLEEGKDFYGACTLKSFRRQIVPSGNQPPMDNRFILLFNSKSMVATVKEEELLAVTGKLAIKFGNSEAVASTVNKFV